MICPQCGKQTPDTSKFCVKCGAPQKLPEVVCRSCGSQFSKANHYCPKCGTPQKGPALVCINCNREIPAGAASCPICGTSQKWTMTTCKRCQRPMKSTLEFCPYCGATQKEVASSCRKCGNPVEPFEFFCQFCGTPLNPSLDYQKPAGRKTPPVVKKRGGCLTIWLLLIIIFSLAGLGSFLGLTISNPYALEFNIRWLRPAFVIISVVSFICAIVTFRMKKWGFYGLLFASLAGMVLIYLMHAPVYAIIISIIGILILLLLVLSRWRYFD
jgi:predicted amidophosphoribosyltransferase